MRKLVSALLLLVVFSLTACGAGKAEAKKADDFLAGLDAFKTADPVTGMDKLADLSSSVVGLRDRAFDFKNGWSLKEGEYARYLPIFNTDATLSVKLAYSKVERISYTFCVKTDKDIYDTADRLIGQYGDPLGVYLNSAPASHSDVAGAATGSKDPNLTYSYAWKTKLRGQEVYVYIAYYAANGINFTYFIVASQLNLNNEIKLWH